MPLFTRCNIHLGCPQNASVKFQSKIPNNTFGVYHLKANELHSPAPSPEEGIAYVYVSLHCISNLQRYERHELISQARR